MLTLWSIFRSPLILGGELRENRPEDLEVITNRNILEINQYSSENEQIFRTRDAAAWKCTDKNGNPVVALFNLSDNEREVSTDITQYGYEGAYKATELWTKEGTDFDGTVSAVLKPHAAAVYRLEKA